VGAEDSSSSNTIAFNGSAGISVSQGSGNAILVNSIFGNTQAGITLQNSGNHDQAAPIVFSATQNSANNTTDVNFSLQSTPNSTFQVFFYSNPAGTANPQGQTFRGTTFVTTDASGFASNTVSFPAVLPMGTLITATATNTVTGDSSAFGTPTPVI